MNTDTTPEATVTIAKGEYKRLIRQDLYATALENGGVDNWEWYDEAMAAYWEAAEALDENDL